MFTVLCPLLRGRKGSMAAVRSLVGTLQKRPFGAGDVAELAECLSDMH